jgi:phenylalanyl-tRNA synthetase beta chain
MITCHSDAVRSSLSFNWDNRKELLYEEISQLLASEGFHEMMNNSITNSKFHEEFFPDTKDSIVRLMSYSNAGLDSLRTSMLFPALEVVRYNNNRKQADLKLFEFGNTYRKEGDRYMESAQLIIVVTGFKRPESWKENKSPLIFI